MWSASPASAFCSADAESVASLSDGVSYCNVRTETPQKWTQPDMICVNRERSHLPCILAPCTTLVIAKIDDDPAADARASFGSLQPEHNVSKLDTVIAKPNRALDLGFRVFSRAMQQIEVAQVPSIITLKAMEALLL